MPCDCKHYHPYFARNKRSVELAGHSSFGFDTEAYWQNREIQRFGWESPWDTFLQHGMYIPPGYQVYNPMGQHLHQLSARPALMPVNQNMESNYSLSSYKQSMHKEQVEFDRNASYSNKNRQHGNFARPIGNAPVISRNRKSRQPTNVCGLGQVFESRLREDQLLDVWNQKQ